MTTLQKPTCATCGNEKIVVDAYAEWDNDTQDWAIQNLFDDCICDDCGGTSINWIEETQP